jgi:HK97 gp10 family phage protein
LSQRLGALTEKVERNILSAAFRTAARTVLADAQRRAPTRAVTLAPGTKKRRATQLRRLALRFARLRNSMSLKPLRRRKGRVGYTVITGTRDAMGIDPSSRYYYPAHVEFGHGPPRIARRSLTAMARRVHRMEYGHGRTPPHPFLRPALKSNETAILAQLASEIDRRIGPEAIT